MAKVKKSMNLFAVHDSNSVMDQNNEISLPLLRKGDSGAIAALMEAHGDRLLRAAFVFCRDPNEAQDLVQETFCRAIPALPGFRGECHLYTWLYGILRHVYFRHARKQRRLLFFSRLPRDKCDASDPEQALEIDERHNLLAEALDKLSAKHREILLLRFGEEMKLREIAELLAISTGTVKSRLHEALKRVRKKILQNRAPVPGREEIHEM